MGDGPMAGSAVTPAALLAELGDPRVVAVDGRSGAGKTTLSAQLAAAREGAVVVHTDDVAWHEAFFDWAPLLAHGVLEPVRRGEAVAFRPPAWARRGREGAILVPAGCPLLVVEGVGAGRRELAPLLDALVWVDCDPAAALARTMAREAHDPGARAFWDEWQAEEVPFLAADRPWERADRTLAGNGRPQPPPGQLLVLSRPRS